MRQPKGASAGADAQIVLPDPLRRPRLCRLLVRRRDGQGNRHRRLARRPPFRGLGGGPRGAGSDRLSQPVRHHSERSETGRPGHRLVLGCPRVPDPGPQLQAEPHHRRLARPADHRQPAREGLGSIGNDARIGSLRRQHPAGAGAGDRGAGPAARRQLARLAWRPGRRAVGDPPRAAGRRAGLRLRCQPDGRAGDPATADPRPAGPRGPVPRPCRNGRGAADPGLGQTLGPQGGGGAATGIDRAQHRPAGLHMGRHGPAGARQPEGGRMGLGRWQAEHHRQELGRHAGRGRQRGLGAARHVGRSWPTACA